MTTSYFSGCRTAEDLIKAYKEAAKSLHPDNGGSAEAFKQMQQEFSKMWERVKSIHADRNGETYTKDTDETADAFMGKQEIQKRAFKRTYGGNRGISPVAFPPAPPI